MLEVIWGDKRHPFAADVVLRVVEELDLNGTLYFGYPVLASLDETVLIDALLTSLEHGIVAVHFIGPDEDEVDLDTLRQTQDELYVALRQKFYSSRHLRDGRELAVDFRVLSLSPSPKTKVIENGLISVGENGLREVIEEWPGISEDLLRRVNAAIQRVTTIKPPMKRKSVQNEGSKGWKIRKIEREIANLDRWQNKAALETPSGPQRIRGLAGSGKTIVLALKAAYLHVLHPEWTIGVTFHTRSLYQQFEDLIRRFTFDAVRDEPDWERLRILHAWGSLREPGLYSEMAVRLDQSPRDFMYGRSTYGYDYAFEGVCQELLDQLNDHRAEPLFDVLLIDEAQDFPQSFFELAYHATTQPKRIVWAYDELQNLGSYSMAPPTELFGLDTDGTPRVQELRNLEGQPEQDIVLPVCYRNTPWTLTVAHALGFGIYREEGLVQFFDDPHLLTDIGYEVLAGDVSLGEHVVLRRSAESSPRFFEELLTPDEAIQCHAFESDDEQAKWVAESIKKNITEDELELRDILIVISDPLTVQKRASAIVNALGEHDIPSHVAGVTTSRDILFSDESVAISSIYRAKGNEAPMVYLLDAEYTFDGLALGKRRNILFTAMTRSRAWVHLAGIGSRMERLIEELERVAKNNYVLEFRIPTLDELETLRRIHKDMTHKDLRRAEEAVENLEGFLEMVEAGNIALENLPPGTREKLSKLLGLD